MIASPLEQFKGALRQRGIVPPDRIESGKMSRADVDGKNGKGDASYIFHDDGIPAGGFENHKDGLGWEGWRADIGRPLAPAEAIALKERQEAARRKREEEREAQEVTAREQARRHWKLAQPATADNAYLKRKRVKPFNVREIGGTLLVPMLDSGEFRSLQTIAADGSKRYWPGLPVRGLYFPIGDPRDCICIAEGYATAATIHQVTGHAVAVAFDAGNLEPVACSLRAKYPHITIILAADNDQATPGNPGLTKATAAARTVGGRVAIPEFGPDDPPGTDFNDLARSDAIRAAIANAKAPDDAEPQPEAQNATAPHLEGDEWPEPQSLRPGLNLAPKPYPLDALPTCIRDAVTEVRDYSQAPEALVAASGLGVLSVAVQGLVDVRRDDGLTGPIGTWFLVIAESGERKSTADRYFSEPIREYEKDQAEAYRPDVARYHAAKEAWEAKRAGLKDSIKQDTKAGNDTSDTLRQLELVQQDEPTEPRVPRLLYADATPEALAHGLARWPSAAVISAEAGAVFGAHAMQRESITRNLAQLNGLWDGGEIRVDRRREGGSFVVNGARLTVCLQVQDGALREFFDRAGPLARGIGFLARFLYAHPTSSQGNRPYRAPPQEWPALSALKRRLADLLAMPVPLNERGELDPPELTFTPDAKALWIKFYNDVEAELGVGGSLNDVRDVAAKAADNAARLSAQFHVVESGPSGAIGAHHVAAACRIVAWHLNEARRFLGDFALPAPLMNASRLDAWLLDYCRAHNRTTVIRRELQNLSPVRDGRKLDEALAELADAGRVRTITAGRTKTIAVNPALLEGKP
jgi:putative DNA primase/helicase